jgi:hypothetical protein
MEIITLDSATGRPVISGLHPRSGGNKFSGASIIEAQTQLMSRDNSLLVHHIGRRILFCNCHYMSGVHADTEFKLPPSALGMHGISTHHAECKGAVVEITIHRSPCYKMAIIGGKDLERQMENQRQGVLTGVVRSGRTNEGTLMYLLPDDGIRSWTISCSKYQPSLLTRSTLATESKMVVKGKDTSGILLAAVAAVTSKLPKRSAAVVTESDDD